jgi:hypothetical protein
LEHDWGIVSQGKEEADHKNKRRSEEGGTRSPDAGREGIPDVRRWEC